MREIVDCSEINSFEIEIVCKGHVLLGSSWQRENVFDFFSRLYYIKGGEGYITHKGKTTRLCVGNVYLIPPECVFSYGCERLEKIYFHISISTLEKYDLLAGIDEICHIPFEKELLDDLYESFYSDSYFSLLRQKAIIYKTVADICKKYSFPDLKIKSYSDVVKGIMKYVQSNTRISLRISDISDKLFLSESTLHKAFRQETGMSIGEYIDYLVFNKAKKLLKQKTLSLGEISTKLGFCDQFYFSRRFKQRFGQTPSQYRHATNIDSINQAN